MYGPSWTEFTTEIEGFVFGRDLEIGWLKMIKVTPAIKPRKN